MGEKKYTKRKFDEVPDRIYDEVEKLDKKYKKKLDNALQSIYDAAPLIQIPPVFVVFDLLKMFVEREKTNGYESVEDLFIQYAMLTTQETPMKETETLKESDPDLFEKLLKSI